MPRCTQAAATPTKKVSPLRAGAPPTAPYQRLEAGSAREYFQYD